jgi:hypothetical protein
MRAGRQSAAAEIVMTAATAATRTNADHLPPPASSYSITERSQHEP